MYRYLYEITDSADKNTFYDTVAEIKKLYPDCTEDTSEVFDRTEMGQILNITDQHGDEAKICIKYEYNKKRIAVMSEIYLFKYYEGKKVDEVFLYSGNRPGRAFGIISSIIFIVVNAISSVLFLWSDVNIVISAVLAVIYLIFTLKVKRKMDIPFADIMQIQLGVNFYTLPILILLGAFVIVTSMWGAETVVMIGIGYLSSVIPALAADALIYGAISLIARKINGSSYPEEKQSKPKKKFRGLFTGLSAAFFAVNVVSAIICTFEDIYYWGYDLESIIIFAVLAAIYIISALLIKRKSEIPFSRIIFIQLGGYFAFILFIISSFLIIVPFAGIMAYYINSLIVGMFMYYFMSVIPALAASEIFSAVIKMIKVIREK